MFCVSPYSLPTRSQRPLAFVRFQSEATAPLVWPETDEALLPKGYKPERLERLKAFIQTGVNHIRARQFKAATSHFYNPQAAKSVWARLKHNPFGAFYTSHRDAPPEPNVFGTVSLDGVPDRTNFHKPAYTGLEEFTHFAQDCLAKPLSQIWKRFPVEVDHRYESIIAFLERKHSALPVEYRGGWVRELKAYEYVHAQNPTLTPQGWEKLLEYTFQKPAPFSKKMNVADLTYTVLFYELDFGQFLKENNVPWTGYLGKHYNRKAFIDNTLWTK